MPIRLTILGSTGSIGRSALDLVRLYPGRFEVVGLAARSNIDLLAAQIDEFKPQYIAVDDEQAGERLVARNLGPQIWRGNNAMLDIASVPVDVVLCAMVGAAGLRPLLRAIEHSRRVALANKESLVMAGRIVMQHARERAIELLPVDSEHSAIFQCLVGHRVSDVQCIHVTASGGPFFGRPRSSLRNVTPEEAASHPRWDMGVKISVDSATLMNKGLEVIEAMWLFNLPLSKIEVLVHPQSIVHSLVEFNDGSILGHLGITDMKFPILFALSWPERIQSSMGRLDLAAVRELTFAAPDFAEFPCLQLALEAAKAGGTAPAILNAANEVAVQAFCKRQIGFLDIHDIVKQVLDSTETGEDDSLETIEAADNAARHKADTIIRALRTA